MKLVSLNVGLPRLLSWKGATFKTAIFKAPVSDRVMLRATNLDGDRQADLSVHGGPTKLSMAIPPSTMRIGASNSPNMTCLGERSVKTGRPRVCWKPRFPLETGIGLDRESSR